MAGRIRCGAWGFAAACALSACSSPLQPPSPGVCATSLTLTQSFTTATNTDLDVVFVLDDGPAMAGWQATLATQLPSLMANLPYPGHDRPISLHVGVVSADLGIGAAANAAIPGCSAGGDGGAFRSQPEGMCTDTTLDPSATFISLVEDSMVGDSRNFSAPDDATEPGAAKVFGCIAQLGDGGCSFGQPLAALDRALGADGQPPPAANAGFLRPDAYLLIVFISNQDDCSVPAGSAFAADPSQGPLTSYRCNRAGHLCVDPSGNTIAPPLDPPSDAASVGGVPSLSLTDCRSNEVGGTLTPVSKFVADIRALKPDPDQILVTGLVGPPSPYTVQWVADGASPSGLRARVAPSCGTEAADGSGAFGEPAVRLAEFIEAFPNGLLASVCDPDYSEVLQLLRSLPDDFIQPPCLTTNLQSKIDGEGRTVPDCTVTEHLVAGDGTVQEIVLPACAAVAAGAPCWSLGAAGAGGCPAGEGVFTITDEPVGPDPAHFNASTAVSCQLPAPVVDAGACLQ
jgi:hypothetical protein